jgi:hypothetical protein
MLGRATKAVARPRAYTRKPTEEAEKEIRVGSPGGRSAVGVSKAPELGVYNCMKIGVYGDDPRRRVSGPIREIGGRREPRTPLFLYST